MLGAPTDRPEHSWRRPESALLRFLRDKHMLLLLDNFEHLRDGVGFVVGILEAAPQVQILATSHERLQVRGEQLFVVEGLAYTQGGPSTNAPTVSAVSLFGQGARRAHPAFQLGEQNLRQLRSMMLRIGYRGLKNRQ